MAKCTNKTALENRYGRNFIEKNVRRMIQFAQEFSDLSIVVPLARQLSWSHFLMLIPLKTQEARIFYAELSISQTLGKRDLRKQIENKTFERTTIANLQSTQIENIPLNTFKDGIMVAEYWTELPPKKELEKKPHFALIEARERFERKKLL